MVKQFYLITDTPTLGLSGLGSNGKKGILNIPQISWTEASLADVV